MDLRLLSCSHIQSGHWIFFFKPWFWNLSDLQVIDKGRWETRALPSVLTTSPVVWPKTWSMSPWHQHPPCILLGPTTVQLLWDFFMKNGRSLHCVIYIFSGLNALWKCPSLEYRRKLVWLSPGHTQMLHGSHRPWMGHPDAHKDSSASIREKEAKCELSIPYLRVKCVQNLGTLDPI